MVCAVARLHVMYTVVVAEDATEVFRLHVQYPVQVLVHAHRSSSSSCACAPMRGCTVCIFAVYKILRAHQSD